eukprot:9614437-Prorocentrum_lima.AAC.1
MSLKFWVWAACQAAYMYRVRALGIQMPESVPTFGHRMMASGQRKDVERFSRVGTRRPSWKQ